MKKEDEEGISLLSGNKSEETNGSKNEKEKKGKEREKKTEDALPSVFHGAPSLAGAQTAVFQAKIPLLPIVVPHAKPIKKEVGG